MNTDDNESSEKKDDSNEELTESLVTEDYIRGRYLHYGKDTLPSFFEVKKLFEFVKRVLRNNKKESVLTPYTPEQYAHSEMVKTRCSFCNKEIVFAWRMNDDRCMCAHCHDHQVIRNEEIKRVYDDMRKMLTDHYHIKLREDINVRFQSAEAIKRVISIYRPDGLISYYNHRKHQMWIEVKGPKVAIKGAVIRELTHCWLYDNLRMTELERKFPLDEREKRIWWLFDIMSAYIQVQTLMKSEPGYAIRLKNKYRSMYKVDYFKIIFDDPHKMENITYEKHMTSFDIIRRFIDGFIEGEWDIPWPERY